MEINDEFKSSWEQNNQRFGINEKFPECVLQISIQIKEFMEPENRIYQGAMGNAKGMVDAIKSYIACSEIDNTEKFVSNINLIIDYLLKIRLTSQVPLNTAFFIRQKLNKLNCNQFCIDDMKKLVADECDFHMTNYNLARDRIAKYMSARIIDRCEEYGSDSIVIGTHCHSGAVIEAIKRSKDHVRQVVVSKTEPEQQGVITASKLLEKGIPVKFINLEQYGTEYRRVNMFLFGIDAVSVEGIVLNKAGTRMIATLAHTKELPVYFLGETYKFARNTLMGGLIRVERRDVTKKLLYNHLGIDLEKYVSTGLLNTDFSAFDTTKPEFYNSIVSERGFLPMMDAFEREWKDYL